MIKKLSDIPNIFDCCDTFSHAESFVSKRSFGACYDIDGETYAIQGETYEELEKNYEVKKMEILSRKRDEKISKIVGKD